MLNIPIIRLIEDAIIPVYAKSGDAGADLVAAESVVLEPGGGRALISTGVAIAPSGYNNSSSNAHLVNFNAHSS